MKKLFRFLEDWEYLLRHEPPARVSRLRLAATYIRLVAKMILREALGIRFVTERFFGYRVSFFEYRDFFAVWREIFLKQIYYYKTDAKAPYIIDGGSNIGLSALYFMHSFPDAEIVCFEPDPRAFGMLVANLKNNGFDKVRCFQTALSDRDGSVTFFSSPQGAGVGNTIKGNSYLDDKPERLEVRTQRLSPFMDRPVDFLKLDIEGSEYEVFNEVGGLFERVRAAVIEVHLFKRGDERVAAVTGALEQAGMRLTVTSFNRKNFQSFFKDEDPYDAFLLAARR